MTQLDDDLIPAVWDFIENDVGRDATFRTYPSRTVNATTSDVTLGTPTDYTEKVAPPWNAVSTITEGGRAIHTDVKRTIMPTGNGTTNAIAFAPTRGQEVSLTTTYDATVALHIHAFEEIHSGALIAAYQLDLTQ